MPESSTIFDKRRPSSTVVQLQSADVPRVTLQTYLKQVLKEDKRLTMGKIARDSNGEISKDYVSGLVNGEYTQPSPDKIIALSKGTGRPLIEILEVIFGKIEQPDSSYKDPTLRAILHEYPTLPIGEQRELKPILDMVLREIRHRKS